VCSLILWYEGTSGLEIHIEFTGLAKSLAGTNTISLVFPEWTIYREVVRKLADLFPNFVGILIAPDGETFLSSTMFVIDGNLANPVMIMNQTPADGECIHLMSIITGG
jgi:hypothetical protein